MSKYKDMLKKEIIQPVVVEPQQSVAIDQKPKQTIRAPPPKGRNCNYDRWEYAYFPHLVNMYRIFSGDQTAWDPFEMHQFFRFIYNVSSGEISDYLDELNENDREDYLEYSKLKDTDDSINEP